MTNIDTLKKIRGAIEGAGGEIFVVGGPVRDMILGIKPKDIDFLVRKMSLEKIADTIRSIGKADEVGKSFGVVKGTIDGEIFDFAIPRIKETKTGVSHTDFKVETDPFASVEDDLNRRDFTCNSMAIALCDFIAGDKVTDHIIDPNGGFSDIQSRTLRAVGNPVDRFTEDPLRMIRGIQFSARLKMVFESETFNAIVDMKNILKTVSGERILEEFKKAWVKGDVRVLIKNLSFTGVDRVLFGDDFHPIPIRSPIGLTPDEVIFSMIVAFFIRGGNVEIMKPEANHVKFLEVARKVSMSNEDPHTFIGNMKPMLRVMLATFEEIEISHDSEFNGVSAKIRKMMVTPLLSKELDITGEELIESLKIGAGKDSARIGKAQRAMLSAIWHGDLENEKEMLKRFCEFNIMADSLSPLIKM